MSKKQFATDLLEQAKSVLNSWGQIDDQLAFGPLSTAALTMAIKRANSIDESITDLENKLTDMRNQREASNRELWNMLKRVRASFKGLYGDDSSQYEMVGGTRMSERKTARRTVPTVEQP
jgi:hypothetical protein